MGYNRRFGSLLDQLASQVLTPSPRYRSAHDLRALVGVHIGVLACLILRNFMAKRTHSLSPWMHFRVYLGIEGHLAKDLGALVFYRHCRHEISAGALLENYS